MSAPACSLERHLADLNTEDCTCPHEWRDCLGVLYGIKMMGGWVRPDDNPDCPEHGKAHPAVPVRPDSR